MLRDALIEHHDHRTGEAFRWRSHEITRIEGFSDAVFGFAVTLLVVSLEVPKTSTELIEVMRGFGTFAITFLMLTSIWYAQFVFFRRYALEDRTTILLNLGLLFTAITFMYPMKFFFGIVFIDPGMTSMVHTAHGLERAVLPEHRPILFAVFGVAFCAVMAFLAALYRHAWRKREAIGLNDLEEFETRFSMKRWTAGFLIGLVYLLLAGVVATKSRPVILAGGVATVLAFGAIGLWMARQADRRKKFLAEWKARQ